jgi:hypothetical protein
LEIQEYFYRIAGYIFIGLQGMFLEDCRVYFYRIVGYIFIGLQGMFLEDFAPLLGKVEKVEKV